MLERKTINLLDLNPQDLDEYTQNPDQKLKDLKTSLKEKINFLQKKCLYKESSSAINEDQMLYYFKQGLSDLENNRSEGIELTKILNKVKHQNKAKGEGSRELLDKFKTSLKTNDQQWKLVTDFMTELFEQAIQCMARKDVF